MVRNRTTLALGAEVYEAAGLAVLRRVVHEVERFAGRRERQLQRVVVVRREDDGQLGLLTKRAPAGGQAGQEMVQPIRLVGAGEDRAELVEQRTLATRHEIDVLRDANEVEAVLAGVLVLGREVRRQLATAREVLAVSPVGAGRPVAEVGARAEEGDDPAGVDTPADEPCVLP